ncbi:MAG: hypothetical protein KDE14_05955 [Rhodobacteraceae bacterium]|nr:hypothetical protein [Paracoccaceae bacterium]
MYDQVINIIQAIERDCDPANTQYIGVNYWPIVRLRLWSAIAKRLIIDRKAAGADNVTNTAPQWKNVDAVDAVQFGPQETGLLRAPKSEARITLDDSALNPDMLFFVRPEEHGDNVSGHRFAKILDSLQALTRPRFSCAKIEFADMKTMEFRRYFPSMFIAPQMASGNIAFDPPGQLERFDDVTMAIARHDPDAATLPSLSRDAIATDIGKIFYFARVFENALNTLKPKALFLSVYYHPVGMAWMLACRRAGIATIDMQHGRLGPIHGMYTHMNNAPRGGYDLMPDRIWCWGPKTKHDIEVDLNPECARHRGIVGSNPWLYTWRHGAIAGLTPADFDEFATSVADRHKILVSLQPLESPLGPELITAMKSSPSHWIWLLRLHPLRRHTAPEIERMLDRAGIANFNIEQATAYPLFALLRIVNHHVTVFSSVVVEAAAFGVRTCLIGTEGRDIFSPQIEKGICTFTPTAETLLAAIKHAADDPRLPPSDDFIDLSEGTVERALSEIMAA